MVIRLCFVCANLFCCQSNSETQRKMHDFFLFKMKITLHICQPGFWKEGLNNMCKNIYGNAYIYTARLAVTRHRWWNKCSWLHSIRKQAFVDVKISNISNPICADMLRLSFHPRSSLPEEEHFAVQQQVGRRERCYEVLPKPSLGDPDHSGHARHWPPPALLEFPENLWVQKCTRLKSGPRLMGRWSRLLKSNKYHPNIHSTFYILHPKVRFFCKILGLANFPGRK